MIIRLILMIFVTGFSVAHAENPTAARLASKDKETCNKEADDRIGVWILNQSRWNEAYYNCLLQRLKALEPKYIANTLEAQRLEALCPESTLNGPATDLSVIGITLAKQLSEVERRKMGATNSIEQTLELYYEKTIQSKKRVEMLRQR